jgi:hypothetical protein
VYYKMFAEFSALLPFRYSLCPAMRTVLVLLLLGLCARADFSWDAFPQSLDILTRLVSAAEQSKESYLTPSIDRNDGRSLAYYVRGASYVGQCRVGFGVIHLLAINYTRSAPKGSHDPPGGHSFVLFFDESLKLRASWRVDFHLSALSIRDGNRLFLGDTFLFDYDNPPKPTKLPEEDYPRSHITIDGQLFVIPTWSVTQ